jgi:Ca-activated chloride channel family protein
MSFLWPPALLALLVVPLLIAAYLWSLRRRRRSAVVYSSLSLIREAAPSASRIRRHLPFALFAASVASLAIGVGRPVALVTVPSGQTSIILAIDVSRSMCSPDIEPDRLTVAQAAAAAFIERQGGSRQIGLVVFAGFAETIQTPTGDQEVLLDAVRSLTTGRRTAIGSAILESIDAIAEVDTSVAKSYTSSSPGEPPEPVPAGAYVPHIVVVLTDGRSNTGVDPVDAAQQAVDRGVRVYTIGFGTADPGDFLPRCGAAGGAADPFGAGAFGPGQFGGGGGGGGGGTFRRGIDEATLKKVAAMTGAEYYAAESAGDLESVFEDLPTYLILRTEAQEVSVVFATIGLLLGGLGMLLGQRWRPLP